MPETISTPGPGATVVVPGMRDPGTAAWEAGGALLHEAVARRLVAAAGDPLAGVDVLDLGAGTGAVSRAAARLGPRLVAVDVAPGPLRHDRGGRPPAVVGDAARLPFADAAFDVVLAGSLSHLRDLGAALEESRRVLRRGGRLHSATFPGGWAHPARTAVDRVLDTAGWRPPSGPGGADSSRAAEPAALLRAARAAGFRRALARVVAVDLGVQSPRALAAWRLGTASVAGFVAGLSRQRAAELRAAVADAASVAAGRSPLRVDVVLLVARAPG